MHTTSSYIYYLFRAYDETNEGYFLLFPQLNALAKELNNGLSYYPSLEHFTATKHLNRQQSQQITDDYSGNRYQAITDSQYTEAIAGYIKK